MADAPATAQQLLDKLQVEVNTVLENIGRAFAVNAQSKIPPTPQIARLKQALPGVLSRYHEALDQLEDNIQLAKLVCRRDFVRAQHEQRQQLQQQQQEQEQAQLQNRPNRNEKALNGAGHLDENHSVAKHEATARLVDRDNDDPMTGTDPEPNGVKEITANPQTSKTAPREKDDSIMDHKDVLGSESKTQQPSNPPVPDNDNNNAENFHDPDDMAQTNAEVVTLDDSSELDALFNDPGSTQPSRQDDIDTVKQADPTSFDFSAFGTDADDNDNISALLPGLQDYANAQPAVQGTGDPELDAIFGTGPATQTNGSQDDPFASTSKLDDFLDFGDFSDGNAFGTGTSADHNMDFSFD